MPVRGRVLATEVGGGRSLPRVIRRMLGILLAGLLIGGLIVFFPRSLGGSTSLIVVTGQSMEPTLHPGDIAVVRTDRYGVGDVVAYRPMPDVKALVIHRIINIKPDGVLVLQGDNNSFIDPFSPTVEDVVGRMIFTIPKVGRVAAVLSNPLVWGSLFILAIGIWLYPVQGKGDERVAPS